MGHRLAEKTDEQLNRKGKLQGICNAGAWENKRDQAHGSSRSGAAFDAADTRSAQAGDGREAAGDLDELFREVPVYRDAVYDFRIVRQRWHMKV